MKMLSIVAGLGLLAAGCEDSASKSDSALTQSAKQAKPVTKSPLRGVQAVDIAVADSHACAVAADGRVICWGDESYNNALGPGVKGPGPSVVPDMNEAESIANGPNVTCVVQKGGAMTCWGDTAIFTASGKRDYSQPLKVEKPADSGATALAMGENFGCAIIDGKVRCFGHMAPQVSTSADADSLIAGTRTICLRHGETVQCSGFNMSNMLGIDEPSKLEELTEIPALKSYRHLAMGGDHSCGIRADGTVDCVGGIVFGVRGDGRPTDRFLQGSKTKSVKLGDQEVEMAVVESPADLDKMGERLDRIEKDLMTPSRVKGLTKVADIVSGSDHVCARTEAGQVWCWGRNHHGQLGDGTKEDRNEPVRVAGIEGAVDIAVGAKNGCALVKGGAVWCWGSNESGVLGTAKTDSPLAVQIKAFGGT